MKIVSAEQMRHLDAEAIDTYGIPGVVLMENAGFGTVRAMNGMFGGLAGEKVVIIAGPGNNGGDGFVIARHLHQQGAIPLIILLVAEDKIKGEALTNFEIVRKLPIPFISALSEEAVWSVKNHLVDASFIVDAIFGTGLKRDVEGHFAEAVKLINLEPCPVIAVDIASGLDSDNGGIWSVAVEADFTVTYGFAKLGHFTGRGPELSGILEVAEIGIPPEAVDAAGITSSLLTEDNVRPWVPLRGYNDHKGSYGHVLIVAGSRGKTGAAFLCGKGALRSGVGLVTLCAPSTLATVYETNLHEAMTVPMAANYDCFYANDFKEIEAAMEGKQAMVVGPGLGVKKDTAKLIDRLYKETEQPMVIDADGLNILAQTGAIGKKTPGPRILTPHPGEMARLTGIATKQIQADRIRISSEFAVKNKVIVVLKGAGTVIADPDGRITINSTGSPAMATGGMGDILAGLIGGLLAQNLTPWQASCLAVLVHGLAADRLINGESIRRSVLASDVAEELPFVFEEL